MDWASGRASVLVLIKRRARQAGAILKEIVRVQIAILPIVVRRTVKFVGPGFDAEVDYGSRGTPVLRAERAGLRAKLLCRVHRRHVGRKIHDGRIQRQSFHQHRVRSRNASVEREARPGAALSRPAARVQHAAESLLYANARGQPQKIDGITTVQRQLGNLAILDDCSDCAARRIQDRCRCFHQDGFARLAHLEREVQASDLIHGQGKRPSHLLFETDHFDREPVTSRKQAGDQKVSGFVRYGSADNTRIDVNGAHLGVDDHRSGLVGDPSG